MGLPNPIVTLSAYLGSAWVDISAYQVGQISGEWGINGNGPIDFVAGTGYLKFSLDNTNGEFTPGHANLISADWKKNVPVKLYLECDGSQRAWYGTVDDFDYENSPLNNGKRVLVTAVDWMNKASKYPINYPTVLTNATADVAIQALINNMPAAPLAQSFAVGVNTLPFVFDTSTDYTYALEEFVKICQSELCYLYLQKDGTYGETLVLENAETRLNSVGVRIPVGAEDCDFLATESDDYIVTENDDYIILDESEDFESNDDANYESGYGEIVINDVRIGYVPRRYVASEGYPLGGAGAPCWDTGWDNAGNVYSSVFIPAGQTQIISGNYRTTQNIYLFSNIGNSTGKILSAPNLAADSTPIARFFNTKSDATGTNISANLSLESHTEKVDKFVFSLKNNGTVDGYLRGYVWGKDLFVSDPTAYVSAQDATSIAVNDYQALTFEQTYKTVGTEGEDFANALLGQYKDPKTRLNRISYCASRNYHNMQVFLNLDVGDMFPVTVSNQNISGQYYVQNVRFTIDPGKIIFFSLGVKEAASDPSGFAGLQVWLDASDLTLSDTDPVATWSDKSGNNNHATQSNASYKPVYVANNATINKPTVKFDGTDDYMALTTILDLSEYTYLVVFAKTTGSANDVILADTDTSYHFLHYGNDWYGPAGAVSTPAAMTTGQFYVMHATVKSQVARRYKNNVALDPSGTAATGTPRFRYIGLPAFICDSEIAEIVIFDRELGSGEQTTLYNYFANKYGL